MNARRRASSSPRRSADDRQRGDPDPDLLRNLALATAREAGDLILRLRTIRTNRGSSPAVAARANATPTSSATSLASVSRS